jgi:hypothetical protein
MSFYLISSELSDDLQFYPVECKIIKNLINSQKQELILVQLFRHLDGIRYHQDSPITHLLLHARNKNAISALLESKQWPIIVNIHITSKLNIELNDYLNQGDYKFVDIGFIFPSKIAAINNNIGGLVSVASGTLAMIMDGKDYSMIESSPNIWRVENEAVQSDISIRERKLSLLTRIFFEFKECLLITDRNPTDNQICNGIKRDSIIWEINCNLDIGKLYDWLGTEEWHLYALKKPFSDYDKLQGLIKMKSQIQDIMLNFPFLLGISSKSMHMDWLFSVNPSLRRLENRKGCLGGFSREKDNDRVRIRWLK